jgi:conjugal transfer pilus assembly protein TraF
MTLPKISVPTTLSFLVICLFLAETAFGTAQPSTTNKQQFFSKDREGWFWYQQNNATEEENATRKIPQMTPQAKEDQDKKFNGFKDIDWEAVWTMHPDDFQNLITDTQKWAIQDPSVPRLKTYIALQKVAKERAVKFQQVWGEALNQNPLLNELDRSPTKIGSITEAKLRRKDANQHLGAMRENMGILYFFSSTCAYCEKQKHVLDFFIEKWQWKNITAINTETDVDAVLKYGVDVVPDMWVVGNFEGKIRKRRIGAGFQTLNQIEKSLLNAWSIWTRNKPYELPETIEKKRTFEDLLDDLPKEDSTVPTFSE